MNITHYRLVDELVEEIISFMDNAGRNGICPPIPVYDIAESLFGLKCDICKLNGRYKKVSGLLIPNKRWIIINQEFPENHQRFTLAHEIGHWLIDHGEISSSNSLDNVLRILRQNTTKGKERIANYFAASLLLPRSYLSQYGDSLYELTDRKIDELSKYFKVSHSTIDIRLETIFKVYGIREFTHSNIKIRKNRNTTRPKKLVIDINYSFIDYRLFRKLRDFREDFDQIYIGVNEANVDDILLFFDSTLIDGFVYYEKESNILNFCKEKGYQYCSLAYNNFYEKVLLNNRITKSNSYMFTRNLGSVLKGSQSSLLNIEKYINSPFPLNYRERAKEYINNQKNMGNRVVIVTGCFDLVTNAHVRFLKKARNFGDVLVVGLEDDARVRLMKGNNRPVSTISQRVELMREFKFVDYVFVIKGPVEEDLKPFYSRLHFYLKPDILAISEGDPHCNDRKDEIEKAGGFLKIAKKTDSDSTSSIIKTFIDKFEEKEFVIIEKELFERLNEESAPPIKIKQLELFGSVKNIV